MSPTIRCNCGREMYCCYNTEGGTRWRCTCGVMFTVGDITRHHRSPRDTCKVWVAGFPCGKPVIGRGMGPGERMVCADCALDMVHQAMQVQHTRDYVASLIAEEEIAEARSRIALAEFQERRAEEERRKAEAEAAQVPVVYYVRLGENHIKIGTTGRLADRMAELRVANRANLLAAEPGTYDVEKKRHRQFALLRYQRRKEDFAESPRLLQHIDDIRHQWGDPWQLEARLLADQQGGEISCA